MPLPTLAVDRDALDPVYHQIARQLRTAIATGGLPPGDPLPPVRRLASDLGVNLNTVARAYRSLQDDGFVEIAGRAGVRVAAPGDGGAEGAERSERFRTGLRELLGCLVQVGLSRKQLERLFESELDALLAARGGGKA